jgi:hypothetical protein
VAGCEEIENHCQHASISKKTERKREAEKKRKREEKMPGIHENYGSSKINQAENIIKKRKRESLQTI